MYHLFETEMRSISAFNGEALRWFSIASILLNCVIAIIVGYAFTTSPLSEFGKFVLYKASWFIGVTTIACFFFGGWALRDKKTVITQIKQETRQDNASPLL